MMDKLKELQERLVASWNNFNTMKKAAIIFTTLSLTFVILTAIFLVNKTNYGVLFSELSETESGVIAKELDDQGIKYKLENNSSKILIDEKHLDKFRIDLAVDDKLPNKSTGFEIFDEKNMMATDEDRKIMYQRAVTGELQRGIETLESIQKAKVMLVIPDKSIFENKTKEATASIVLTLHDGQQPAESAIQGIASLTSGAVENLPTKNIKIVDDQGNVLSNFLEEDNTLKSTDLASKYQLIKTDFEKNLETKTTALLESVFSEEQVRLSINVDLDFDSIEKTTVKYADPKIRSENVQASGGTVNAQEVQGGNVNDNVSNVVGGGNGQGNKTYERNVNNELDTETTTVLNAPGVVKKITASVLVNQTLSGVEISQLENIIQSAIGYEAERGDTIAVQGMTFAKGQEESLTEKTGATMKNSMFQSMKPSILIIGGIIGLLVMILLILVIVMKGRKKVIDEEPELDVQQIMVEPTPPIVEKVPLVEEPLIKELEPEELIFNELQEREAKLAKEAQRAEAEQLRLAQMMTDKEQQAKKYAKENPDLAAELIKVWMKDK
ncbi:flagellar basal-body MS-ring/collar protein FliF [Vagococcus salmoninarum]|uniref:Flagellar M-ring protein n=1 Tax=Vagococcus salmoninarum TaxID=2739 RepID=A0A429ZSV8_9ENTE|nr:flagellar basal-body MS-ring/collar protein FliF [Vagococcus salmoninarum]RST96813.1 flagellar M-ring protein FliF [Vagococcus salmoninarum]